MTQQLGPTAFGGKPPLSRHQSMREDFQLFGEEDDDNDQLARNVGGRNGAPRINGENIKHEEEPFLDFDTFVDPVSIDPYDYNESYGYRRSPLLDSPYTFDLDESPDLIPDSPSSSSPHSYPAFPTFPIVQPRYLPSLFPTSNTGNTKSSLEEVKNHFVSLDLSAYSSQSPPTIPVKPLLSYNDTGSNSRNTVSPKDVSPNLSTLDWDAGVANLPSLFSPLPTSLANQPSGPTSPSSLSIGGIVGSHKRNKKSVGAHHPFSIPGNAAVWNNGTSEDAWNNGTIEENDSDLQPPGSVLGRGGEEAELDGNDSDASLLSPPLALPLILTDTYFGIEKRSHDQESVGHASGREERMQARKRSRKGLDDDVASSREEEDEQFDDELMEREEDFRGDSFELVHPSSPPFHFRPTVSPSASTSTSTSSKAGKQRAFAAPSTAKRQRGPNGKTTASMKKSKAKAKAPSSGKVQVQCDVLIPIDSTSQLSSTPKLGSPSEQETSQVGLEAQPRICGVVFRRATDLIRHKENIHGTFSSPIVRRLSSTVLT
jgi:hypothetical protein